MAALDFPDNPTNGQVYDKWTWNGTMWVLTAGSGGGGSGSGFTFSQEATPTATAAGQTWYNTATGISSVWVVDANSSQWVQYAPGGGSSVVAGVSLGNSVSQSIPNATNTPVTFDQEFYDIGDFHTGSSSRVTIPAGLGGTYIVGYTVAFFPLATGLRNAWLRRTGNTTELSAASLGFGSAAYPGRLGGTATFQMAAGDYVELCVSQDSGGAAPIYGNNSAVHMLEFYAWRLA